MMISALADTHHLLANDVMPRFPYIYKSYFGEFVNAKLLNEFSDMYERTYLRLGQEYPEQEYRRLAEKETMMKLLGTNRKSISENDSAMRESLIQKCKTLNAKSEEVVNWSTSKLLDFYIENLDNDVQFQKSISPWLSSDQKARFNMKLIKMA